MKGLVALHDRRKIAREAPRPKRINGQTVGWKAAAGFGVGPFLMYSAVAPASAAIRMGLGAVGAAVTVIDAGHVMRHWFRERAR